MKDIEDTVFDNKLKQFLIELVQDEFESQDEFTERCVSLRTKYKLSPNKPLLRKIYFTLLKEKEIQPNPSFLEFSLKKKVRSNSGVSVITILTSPTPEYTNQYGERVTQSFSCGKSCAYCPNEPEIRLHLTITDVNPHQNMFKVTTQDDIHIIRSLNYILYRENQYPVESCSHFTDKSFIIEMKEDTPFPFHLNDELIGVKIEQPRSYLSTEPAVLRANRDNFDPVLQIYDRADALMNCGHEVDKIEVLVLGGTWDHYPLEYQREFIRDIYFAINNLERRGVDIRLSMEEEIHYSQTSGKRMIGLTLETRPDCIHLKQVQRIREFNVTRLQIGVQHIDDEILNHIERGCTTQDTIQGNQLWKHNGGKVDWHLMPDLPGSSVEKDIEMFRKIFSVNHITHLSSNHVRYELEYPELQADQLKIYPCSVVDWTKIKEWYENGSYQPYSENEEDLIQVIAFIKRNIFPWIRLNRIIRDIPTMNIIGGNKNVNLRQKLLADKNINCQCIRCREVKGRIDSVDQAQLFIREYNGVHSTEFFISFESPDQQILYGFLRLRINHSNQDLIYEELHNCSFIRELHVYGSIVKHHSKDKKAVQHMGFGKRLVQEAEKISQRNGHSKIAIISGVGVREYYENSGYRLVKDYMIKEMTIQQHWDFFEISLIIAIILILISLFV